MSKYISRKAPITTRALKRKQLGTVVVHHWNYGEAKFTRITGGWLYELETSVWVHPAEVVSSADVAAVCNHATGCKDSWARIF